MGNWDRDRRLDEYLAFLTQRINQLETRVRELEAEAKTGETHAAEAVRPGPPVGSPGQSPAVPAQPPAVPAQPSLPAQPSSPLPSPARPAPGPVSATPPTVPAPTPPAGLPDPWKGVPWAGQPPAGAGRAFPEARHQAAEQLAAGQQAAGQPGAGPWTAGQWAAGQRAAGQPVPQHAAPPTVWQRNQASGQVVSAPGWARPGTVPPRAETHSSAAGGPAFDLAKLASLSSLRDLESRLTGRVLAWVGGAAVLLGVVFFLSLAFSRGWIGPEGRVFLGVLGGIALMAAGARLFDRKQASLGHVLVAVGLGVVSLSLFAGTRLYGLYAPEWALAGSFAAAVGAAAIAIRANSEALAIYGLLAIAAAPPIMGAPANAVTVGFLGATVIGTTLIALWRSWRWLPPAAFVITAPQLAYWLAVKPEPATAVAAVAAFWALNAVAASADDLRAGEGSKPDEAKPTAETQSDLVSTRAESLFLANSLLAIIGGLWVLTDAYQPWQGAFLAGVAIAHFIVGGFFVRRRGGVYPFGLLANAIGVVVVALAIERQFDGILVPIGWAIEGVALAFFYGRRKNDYAGVAAAIIGGLQILHLLVYEYPWLSFSVEGHASTSILPFANEPGVALVGVLMAAAMSGGLVRNTRARASIGAVGALFFAYTLPFQLTGPALVAAWAILGAGLLAFWRTRRFDYLAALGIPIAGLSVLHLLAFEFPLLNWTLEGRWGPGVAPFADQSALALGFVLVAALAGGWLSRSTAVRLGLFATASALVAYALPFELRGAALVAAWSAVATVLIASWRIRRLDDTGLLAAGIACLAVVHVTWFEYPLWKWTLAGTGASGLPFTNESALALAAMLLAAVVAGWLSRSRDIRDSLFLAGSLLVAYALPFDLTGPALLGAWSAEVAAMALVWGWRRHEAAAAAAVVPAFLALANFGAYRMPLDQWRLAGGIAPSSPPFADAAGLCLAILFVAGGLAAAFSRSHSVRCAAAAGGLLLVAYALPYELSGVALVGGWVLLMPASVAVERLLDLLPGVPESRARLARVPIVSATEIHWPDSPLLGLLVATLLALGHLYAYELPTATIGSVVVPATPFVDETTLAAALVAGCLLLAAALTLRADLRVAGVLLATLVVATTVYFELALPYAVSGWVALAIGVCLGLRFVHYGRAVYVAAMATLVALSVGIFLATLDPPDRMGVLASVSRTGLWFAVDSAVPAGLLALAGLIVARQEWLPRRIGVGLTLASGVLLVYLASTLVVNVFQGQVGGRVTLEELQKQAQVGVSITWGVIGMAVFLVGVIRWRAGVREAGLALLGLATAKVFLFDLSYLDVAYRVLSLIGLGLLLLLGAFVYQSLARKGEPSAGGGGQAPGS